MAERRTDQGTEPRRVKVCNGCGEEKPLDEYHKTSRTKDGRIGRCKPCKATYNDPEKKRAYDLVYREVNRDRRLAGYRRYNAENAAAIAAQRSSEHGRMVHRMSEARRRAAKAELPREAYTFEQILMRDGEECWLCGAIPEKGKLRLDHLIPILANPEILAALSLVNPGDVLANVSITCVSCNSRKSNKIMPEAVARYQANLLVSNQDNEEEA